jgi:folate/biopterin transporter
MGTVVHDSAQLLATATIGSLTVAFSDVVVDSIAVERSKGSTLLSTKKDNSVSAAGDLQSLCWASAAIGGICSAYFSGSLLQSVAPRTVFLITSLFPLFTAGASIAISENKFDTRSSAGSTLQDMKLKVKEIFSTLKQPSIYLPVLFVFMWQATPSPDTAMFYFYTSQLGFTPEFLGRLRLVSSIASLLGVLTYRTYLKSVPLKRILFWTAITSVPLGLSQTLLTSHINRNIGIPDDWFTLTDSVVLTVLGQISFMPILALAAALCPPGVEGTLFASLMAIYNAAGTVSSELGAALMSFLNITSSNFDNLTLLIVICSLSSLLPLPFLDTLLSNKLLDRSSAE